MNRNKNRFLSVIFACFFALFMVADVWAAGCDSEQMKTSYWYGNNTSCPYCWFSSSEFVQTCGNGTFTCKAGTGARYSSKYYYQGYNHNIYLCHRCVTGTYTVSSRGQYDTGNNYSGTELGCGTCPSDLAAAHVTYCSNENDYGPGLECEDGYNMKLNTSTVGNTTTYSYTCECTNTGDSAYDVYPLPNGKCARCSNANSPYYWNNDAYKECVQDGNHNYNTINCYPWGYKGVSVDTTDNTTKWRCTPCPTVNNASALGVGSGKTSARYVNNVTWSTSVRCQFATAEKQDNDGNKYIDTIRPSSACATVAYVTNDTYSVGSSSYPNVSNLSYYTTVNDGCNYELVTRRYTHTIAGYGVSNNNTANATVSACASGKYSSASDLACKNVPSHAVANSDRSGFICDIGYFQWYGDCVRCPMNVDMEISYSDWDYGTTGAAGATSANSCYVMGSSANGSDDGTGYKYTGGMCPYNNGGFFGYYLVCLEVEAVTYGGGLERCKNALIAFAENVVGVGTGYGQGNSWAEGFLGEAMHTNCAYMKQTGQYQGAGVILTDGNRVKQLFTHPQYNILDECHGIYVWTY